MKLTATRFGTVYRIPETHFKLPPGVEGVSDRRQYPGEFVYRYNGDKWYYFNSKMTEITGKSSSHVVLFSQDTSASGQEVSQDRLLKKLEGLSSSHTLYDWSEKSDDGYIALTDDSIRDFIEFYRQTKKGVVDFFETEVLAKGKKFVDAYGKKDS